MLAALIDMLAAVRAELLLFAAVGLLIGGIDDLVVDLIYGARRLWRRATVYSRFERMTTATLTSPAEARRMAVFVPAWDESAVIGAMLRRTLDLWRDEAVHIFVGCYPNDRPTIDAVTAIAAGEPRVTVAINPLPGATTKADCLNTLWRAMLRVEAASGEPFGGVVLHDAEDVVHRDALRLMAAMLDRFDFVQLPVLPLASNRSRWVAGHYGDEFAEAHAKLLTVREAIGAALPSAGVGCAFARDRLGALDRDGRGPFDAASLTEDYELGLRLGEQGARGVLVRMRDAGGELVATREYFPDRLDAAVRQKARWMVGIALAGWDRLGWRGGVAERWMRLHDRRGALAAVVLLAAYAAVLLSAPVEVARLLGHPLPGLREPLPALLGINALLLGWRMLVRALFVGRAYGWRAALWSAPRLFVGNLIALMAARRALGLYIGLLRGATLRWDKTEHRFPVAGPAAR
jgi:adsorption protein B